MLRSGVSMGRTGMPVSFSGQDVEAADLASQTDETNLEPVSWPRAAAFAEVFWTGAERGLPERRSRFIR